MASLPAGAGSPTAICGGLPVTIVGSPDNDFITGTSGPDVIAGLGGDDVIRTAGGDDVVCGGPGNDHIHGGKGADRIFGSSGSDMLRGGPGDDWLAGGAGNDRLVPGSGDDVAIGGGGSDRLDYSTATAAMVVDLIALTAEGSGTDTIRGIEVVAGSRFDDQLRGSEGPNRLIGRGGDDQLDGGGGNDRLIGNRGDHDLAGGDGSDRAVGGQGFDTCVAERTLSCETAGRGIYVATTGSDTADVTTPEAALRTISTALRHAVAGDTVFVFPGTYRESVRLDGIGRAGGAPIVVTGLGGRPMIDGEGIRSLGFFCENCTNVELSHFEIANFRDVGAGATLSSGITLRDLVVHENGFAVRLIGWELEGYGIHVDESSGVLIEGNDVHANGPNPPVFPDRLLGTGINTYGNRDVIIKNNRSHGNHGGGILVEDSVNVLVIGNEVFENDLDASADQWWDGGLWVDGGRDVVVRGNVFRDNLGPGIEISDEDGQRPTGYVIEDNVSTGNYFGINVWNFGTPGWPASDIISQSGNDFSGNLCGDVWITRRPAWRDCP